MTTTRRRGVQVVAALGVAVTSGTWSAGCTTSTKTDGPGPALASAHGAELVLTFEDLPGPGAVVAGSRDVSATPHDVLVETRDGGRVLADLGPDGLASRFPAAGASSLPAAAVVVLPAEPAGAAVRDSLAPGADDFRYGADVVLDAVSDGPGDDGDNVLQRGLYADPSQFKLQLDHGRPACRVAGTAGVAFVKAGTPVLRDRWYRLECARRGDVLHLHVRRWEGTGWGDAESWSTRSPVGAVEFTHPLGAPGVPLSVGAKVGVDGQIPSDSSDQLNGAVDNVFVDLADQP